MFTTRVDTARKSKQATPRRAAPDVDFVRRNLEPKNDTACRGWVAGFGFAKADETVLKQRKILSVRRKRPDAAAGESV